MPDATTEFFQDLANIGHLELLDIPGRWGRVDAFGRGRVNV